METTASGKWISIKGRWNLPSTDHTEQWIFVEYKPESEVDKEKIDLLVHAFRKAFDVLLDRRQKHATWREMELEDFLRLAKVKILRALDTTDRDYLIDSLVDAINYIAMALWVLRDRE